MAHDLDKPYEYPFEVATEEEINFKKAQLKGGLLGSHLLMMRVVQLDGHPTRSRKCTL